MVASLPLWCCHFPLAPLAQFIPNRSRRQEARAESQGTGTVQATQKEVSPGLAGNGVYSQESVHRAGGSYLEGHPSTELAPPPLRSHL